MKRISLLALAVVLLLSSCGDSDSDTPGMESSDVSQTAAETEETAPYFTRSGNPEDLDLNGEAINLWSSSTVFLEIPESVQVMREPSGFLCFEIN